MALVKEGFCWPAFFLSLGWVLWRRLWRAAILLLAAGAALEAGMRFIGADAMTGGAAWLGYSLLVGFGANDWRRGGLRMRGYRQLGVVAAANRAAALRRFFDLHPEPPAIPGVAIGVPGI